MNRAAILTAAKPPEHSIDVTGIPEELTSIPRWVCWKWIQSKTKWGKIPVQASGFTAATNDPQTWQEFSVVADATTKKKFGLGFVFNGDGLAGIDLDDCRNPITGELATWASEIVQSLSTYSEVSPSLTGVKLFVRAELPEHFTKKHTRPDGCGEVEIYCDGRFFTVTGQRVTGTPAEVQDRTSELAELLSTMKGWKVTPPSATSPPTAANGFHHSSADDRQTALAALGVLDPLSHYDDWLRIGMALHSVDTSLLGEWDRWSQGAGEEKHIPDECARKWNGFSAGGGGVSIGTLCHMADATGTRWRPQPVAKAAASPPPPAARILPPGSRVLAGDKGNIGTVVNDGGGSSVSVHFVSPEGNEATKDIPRSQLKFADGRPVVPSDSPAILIRSAGELIGEFPEMRPAILEGLLRCGETMNIIASPKTGKSWLSMGLGLSVVSGRKWLDQFWTRRGKVLIVDNELHPETSAQRLPRIAEAMGIQPDEYADKLFVANLRGQLIDLNALAVQLGSLEPGAFSLIVLDAWYRFQPTGSDENSNGDVAQLYNLLDSVANKLGSAFVCIHHTSKGNQGGKGVTDVRAGAGAQSRAPDAHLTIRQHEEDGAFVVEAAVRSFAPMEPFCLRWNFPVWTPADDLDPKDLRQERPRKAKSSATESGESSEDARQQRDQEARQKVLDAYATFPDGETASMVRDAAGMNSKVFGPINAQLIRDGVVRACRIQKNGREYDGACLVKLGHSDNSDKTLFSVSESECPTDRDHDTRTSVPPLGDAVCPSDIVPVGGLVRLSVGKESD